jgi:hypothetical protein
LSLCLSLSTPSPAKIYHIFLWSLCDENFILILRIRIVLRYCTCRALHCVISIHFVCQNIAAANIRIS